MLKYNSLKEIRILEKIKEFQAFHISLKTTPKKVYQSKLLSILVDERFQSIQLCKLTLKNLLRSKIPLYNYNPLTYA